MTNVKYPIYFSEYYPHIPSQTDPSQTVNSTTPHYHDITIQNLVSTGSPYGGVIVGVPEMPITNIHLKNVSISSSAGIQVRNASVDTSNVNIKVSSGSPYILEVGGTVGSVTFVKNEITLSGYTLEQNYPNPFNPTTQIRFNMPEESVVTIKIYNMLGKEIKTLISGEKTAGEHSVTWNGTNDRGILVASGTYFYRINTGNFTQVKKMIFMK